VALWFHSDDKKRRQNLILGLLAGLIAVLVARVLAHVLPFEVRPMFAAGSGFKPLSVPGSAAEDWSSFPSDNAAFTLAVALGLFSVNRKISIALAVVVAVIYGVFRVYSGFHYPADIVAGWMIAVASVIAVRPMSRIFDLIAWPSIPEHLAPILYAGSFVALTEYASMFHAARAAARMIPFVSGFLHPGR